MSGTEGDATHGVDPGGPVFVSYRQSDGTEKALTLAWLLRSAGVPVWQDGTDLPPGDTNERLAEALVGGLSGAVLLITPETARSVVMRTVEVPQLLRLEQHSDFLLVVGNTIRMADGHVDYAAPDKLLGMPLGTLRRLKQNSADTPDGLRDIARDVVVQRLERRRKRIASNAATLTVSVQTRSVPHSIDAEGDDLSIRVRPPLRGRLPDPRGLVDLTATLPLLPEAISVGGARAIRITGGAHLSVALAVGCALPATLIGSVEVTDAEGATWMTGAVASPPGGQSHLRSVGNGAGAVRPTGHRRAVLVYLDLLPTRSDAAYARLLEEHGGEFDAWTHLRPAVDGRLNVETAGDLISEAAHRLRSMSDQNDNADLHLLPRCPFPVAVLLGRLLNTLRVNVYEWDDSDVEGDQDTRPRYVPTLRLRPTAAGGPIERILLT